MDNLYPKICIDPDNLSLDQGYNSVSLEIGFGGAEHLIWQAKHNPDVLFLGAEPFINGVAKALMGIEDNGLDNVRLLCGDGRDILENLPDNSLDRFYLLFPDPWPKTRHNKRRIVTEGFIEHIHRTLKPNGVFRFGSDINDYVDWTFTRIRQNAGFVWEPRTLKDWRERPADWPETRYEAKAKREGRPCHYFEFLCDK